MWTLLCLIYADNFIDAKNKDMLGMVTNTSMKVCHRNIFDVNAAKNKVMLV